MSLTTEEQIRREYKERIELRTKSLTERCERDVREIKMLTKEVQDLRKEYNTIDPLFMEMGYQTVGNRTHHFVTERRIIEGLGHLIPMLLCQEMCFEKELMEITEEGEYSGLKIPRREWCTIEKNKLIVTNEFAQYNLKPRLDDDYKEMFYIHHAGKGKFIISMKSVDCFDTFDEESYMEEIMNRLKDRLSEIYYLEYDRYDNKCITVEQSDNHSWKMMKVQMTEW